MMYRHIVLVGSLYDIEICLKFRCDWYGLAPFYKGLKLNIASIKLDLKVVLHLTGQLKNINCANHTGK